MKNNLIASSIPPVSKNETCGNIFHRFCADDDLIAIAVVDKGRAIGLLKRVDFLTKLADQYGWPLYEAKPVTLLMDDAPVTIEQNHTLESMNEMMLADESALRHGFIVTENGFYRGIGTASALLQANMERAETRMQDLEFARKKAQSASLAKSRFLANMSHELRTPLNAIIGFSELILSDDTILNKPDQTKDYIGDIHHSGKHLLKLINSILDMSKIEAGAFQLTEDYYSPQELVSPVIRIMTGMALSRNIRLIVDGFDQNDELFVDIQYMKQVLINLLSNAIKFSNKDSIVRLEYSNQQSGGIIISVDDEGPGINQNCLQHVMEPFVQAETGHDRRFEGTGLGLPIIKAYVEAHDGQFCLKSAVGRGTRAEVHLPPNRCQKSRVLSLAI